MEKLITHTGIGVPLCHSSVGTGQIIPAVYLRRVTRTGFEDTLFAAWHNNPKFILNRDACKNGFVLIAGPDFGTDSSREYVVRALKDYSFHVVLAPEFADTLCGNSGRQDLVIGIIPQEDYIPPWRLFEAEPGTEVTVSLEDRTWQAGAISGTFQIDGYVRWTLMEGLDDTALTLCHEGEIAAYEVACPSFKPCTLPVKFLPKEEIVPIRG